MKIGLSRWQTWYFKYCWWEEGFSRASYVKSPTGVLWYVRLLVRREAGEITKERRGWEWV